MRKLGYKANDGIVDSSTATVTIDVTNNAPMATDVVVLLNLTDASEGGSGYTVPLKSSDVTITAAAPGLRAGVDDIDGDLITISIMSNPSYGQLTLNSDGSIVFAPDEGFEGVDSFTFTVSDGIATSRTATATILVAGAAPEPAGAMAIFAELVIRPHFPPPPVPPLQQVLIKPFDPDDPMVIYYNHWASNWNAGTCPWPFAGSPVGGGFPEFDYAIRQNLPSIDPVLGRADDVPRGYNGVVLVPYDDGTLSGVIVQEYLWGWYYKWYDIRN